MNSSYARGLFYWGGVGCGIFISCIAFGKPEVGVIGAGLALLCIAGLERERRRMQSDARARDGRC